MNYLETRTVLALQWTKYLSIYEIYRLNVESRKCTFINNLNPKNAPYTCILALYQVL